MKTPACVAFSAMFLSACAPRVYQLPMEATTGGDIELQDARPAWEKTRETGSFVVTSCKYGLTRFGDESTTPDRTRYLEHKLETRVAQKLAGKDVRVLSFTLYDNSQGTLRRNAVTAGVGPVLGSLGAELGGKPLSTEGCDPTFVMAGLYPGENPTDQPVVISNLSISVDGTVYRSRVVEPPGPDAIQRAVSNVVDGMAAQLSK